MKLFSLSTNLYNVKGLLQKCIYILPGSVLIMPGLCTLFGHFFFIPIIRWRTLICWIKVYLISSFFPNVFVQLDKDAAICVLCSYQTRTSVKGTILAKSTKIPFAFISYATFQVLTWIMVLLNKSLLISDYLKSLKKVLFMDFVFYPTFI